MTRTRANALTDNQVAILQYFMEARYVTKSEIDRWPAGLVDKFRPQLQALEAAYPEAESIVRLIPPKERVDVGSMKYEGPTKVWLEKSGAVEQQFKTAYVDLLGKLQQSLPAVMRKTTKPGSEGPLMDPLSQSPSDVMQDPFALNVIVSALRKHIESIRGK